jgi:acetylglutamate kinase
VISRINRSEYKTLKENDTVNEGMIPKLDNAFQAIDAGVSRVVIGKADRLSELLNGNSGTTLSNE